ncbi:L-rhamnose mutarotase [Micromonospora sp. NPDC050686]|uniref:L-rhamnose mutarotase n=1 Tax=Micromonospora sp. NPDC050686 TaxID=3154631 RepID=UPI0033FBA110
MMIVALRTRLRKGHEAEYKRDHARIPKDLVAAFRDVGISGWRIWRSGRDLFHVVECKDWQSASATLSRMPAEHAWQTHIGKHLEQPTDDDGTPLALVAHEVWDLSKQLES